MHSRKSENQQLEDLLSEYFKTRSPFPYGTIKNDQLSTNEENNLVQQKYNKAKTSVFEFKTYCSMTSLHGYVHFVENNFNKTGKFIWAMCLVAMYITCGFSIYTLINQYSEMPAIFSLDNSVSSNWKIPFPAVTVCSANKIRPSVYDYTADDNNTDFDDQLIRNTMHGICEKDPTRKQLKVSQEYLDGSFVSQVLKNLSFPCAKVIKYFYWLQIPELDPCNVWFQETFTSYGLCYSFNMMPMGDLLNGVDEWSQEDIYGWKRYESSWQPDSGYKPDALINHMPVRTFGETDYHSATMQLDLHTEDFSRECAHGMEVFYILIHSPAEWPDRSHPTLLASPNTLHTMSVKPMVLSTFDELAPWSPERRHCYFQNEKTLRFFKVYTQKNCILECRSSNILARCGCVPFYHLRMKNTPVCGPSKISCWMAASQTSSESCQCLPACSELHFQTSTMKAYFNESAQKEDLRVFLLSIFYLNKNYIGSNRILTSTFGQFIGNVGGIMGLCLGFSFLSLAEIIYFLTLRPLVNYYNMKKKMKKVDVIDIVK